jgi:DNA polymerase III subunit delta'
VIIGHIRQREALFRLLTIKRLPSALLFSGQSGIGKRLVAEEVAKTLLCDEVSSNPKMGGCGSCPSCAFIQARTHPDLHQLDCGTDAGSVESVRELLCGLGLKSFRGGARIAILNRSDELNLQAANALLKSLEEPRPDTYFVLIAANSARLPSTILSRCQRWHFERLSDVEVKKVISDRALEVPDDVISLAEGSVELATILSGSAIPVAEITEALDAISRGDQTALVGLVRSLAADKETLPQKLIILRTHARQQMDLTLDSNERAMMWATFLSNVVEADRLLFDRNFNPALILFSILSTLDPKRARTFTEVPLSGNLARNLY